MTTSIRFGLPGGRGGIDPASPVTALDLACEAEGQGYDCVWLSEEHFSVVGDPVQRRRPSVIPVAAAIAARTSRIRIGFSVLLLPLHDPLRLAEDIATVDVLSGGRIELGIGWPNDRYVGGFGRGRGDTALEDTLARVLELWSRRPIMIDDVAHLAEPSPSQRPFPPICVAAYDDATIGWAAARGYGLLLSAFQTSASLRRCLARFGDEGGTVSTSPVERFCMVAETDAVAHEKAAPLVLALTDRLKRSGRHGHANRIVDAELDPACFCRDAAIVGDPDTVARRIAELRDEMGIGRINLRPSFWGNASLQQQRDTAAMFAAEVIPRLRLPVAATEQA